MKTVHPLQELRVAMREVQEARAFIIGWSGRHSTLVAELTVMPLVADLSHKADELCRLLEEVVPVNRELLHRVIQGAQIVAMHVDGPEADLRDAVKHYTAGVRDLMPLPEEAKELNGERRLPVGPVEFCGVPGCAEHRASDLNPERPLVAHITPAPGKPFRPITCAADLPNPGDPLVR